MEVPLLRGKWVCEMLVDNFCSEVLCLPFLMQQLYVTYILHFNYYIHLHFVFLYICTLCSVFARYIFPLMCLIHPNMLFFPKTRQLFQKTKIFFEPLSCKRGHMPIFVLRLRKRSVGKRVFEVQFLKQFYDFIYIALGKSKSFTEEIQKMYIFNHYEKCKCNNVFLRYLL